MGICCNPVKTRFNWEKIDEKFDGNLMEIDWRMYRVMDFDGEINDVWRVFSEF
jgi:hypothetical protein